MRDCGLPLPDRQDAAVRVVQRGPNLVLFLAIATTSAVCAAPGASREGESQAATLITTSCMIQRHYAH